MHSLAGNATIILIQPRLNTAIKYALISVPVGVDHTRDSVACYFPLHVKCPQAKGVLSVELNIPDKLHVTINYIGCIHNTDQPKVQACMPN